MQFWTLQPEQVKQVKCLKNKYVNVTSTSAENTGAFINIIPAKTDKKNLLFPQLLSIIYF